MGTITFSYYTRTHQINFFPPTFSQHWIHSSRLRIAHCSCSDISRRACTPRAISKRTCAEILSRRLHKSTASCRRVRGPWLCDIPNSTSDWSPYRRDRTCTASRSCAWKRDYADYLEKSLTFNRQFFYISTDAHFIRFTGNNYEMW